MADFGLGEIAAGASLLGTGVSALGAISTGQANAAAANYQAEVARNNAITAEQNAAYALQAGNQKATNESLKGRAEGQHLKAEIAANSIDVNTGSPVVAETTEQQKAQLDTETTRQDAALAAYGYRAQSTNFTAQSQLDTAKAVFDTTAGFIGAGGSLLSGAGDIGLKWAGLTNPSSSRSAA